jgi:hypothetical protein
MDRKPAPDLPGTCGVVPLGIIGDRMVLVGALGNVLVWRTREATRMNIFLAFGCDVDKLVSLWPVLGRDGGVVDWSPSRAAAHLVALCHRKGVIEGVRVSPRPRLIYRQQPEPDGAA